MTTKDYFTIAMSFFALIISLYNFYLQQVRRKEHLIGSMISVGVNDGDWDRKMEYSISNIGDVQLVVKEVSYITCGLIVRTNVVGLPVVLKPGEMALFDILYKNSDVIDNSTEIVELGIFSASGKGYRLPHVHRHKGHEEKERWGIFALKSDHEGF